jgi:hypothetical protein
MKKTRAKYFQDRVPGRPYALHQTRATTVPGPGRARDNGRAGRPGGASAKNLTGTDEGTAGFDSVLENIFPIGLSVLMGRRPAFGVTAIEGPRGFGILPEFSGSKQQLYGFASFSNC